MGVGVLSVNEQAVRFGRENPLVGVVTEPAPSERTEPPPACLFLNAGLVHHVGPNRLYVTLARWLAASGFLGLRFDFSGVGDSAARADHMPFDRSAVIETREAMDWLSGARSVDRFILTGICSGATFSLQAASLDPRVVGVVLINFQGAVESEVRSFVAERSEARHVWQVSLFSARSWAKLLTGRADYRGIARTVGTKLGDVLTRRRRLLPQAEADLARVRGLLERGVRVLAVYSAGDPGWDYLGFALGDRVGREGAGANLSVVTVPGADHTFTPFESRERLLKLIDDWTGGFR